MNFSKIILICTLFLLVISCVTETTPTFTLTTSFSGEGTVSPSGGNYEQGESITLTGIPSSNWVFDSWGGDAMGSSTTLEIIIDSDKYAIANFVKKNYPLNIDVIGEGTVAEEVIIAKNEYKSGTMVKLTPVPESGRDFIEWRGDISGNTYPTIVEVISETSITAVFTEIILNEGEVFNPATSRIWMDRNLGASRVAISSDDSLASGYLFQWGRPMDGHQNRNSTTISKISSTTQPDHGHFILVPDHYPWDWISPRIDDLWSGQDAVNNPCPDEFRIPTVEEWENEVENWISKDRDGAFDSPLNLPSTGYRRELDGHIYGVGFRGFYWSSTVRGTEAIPLKFDNILTTVKIRSRRASGFSVRCIKD